MTSGTNYSVCKLNLQRASHLLQKSKTVSWFRSRTVWGDFFPLVGIWQTSLAKRQCFSVNMLYNSDDGENIRLLSLLHCHSAVLKSYSWHFVQYRLSITSQAKADKMQWKSDISLNIVFFVSAVCHVSFVHGMDTSVIFFGAQRHPSSQQCCSWRPMESIFCSRLGCIFTESCPKCTSALSPILLIKNVPPASLGITLHCDQRADHGRLCHF